jgi:hypothetical protein
VKLLDRPQFRRTLFWMSGSVGVGCGIGGILSGIGIAVLLGAMGVVFGAGLAVLIELFDREAESWFPRFRRMQRMELQDKFRPSPRNAEDDDRIRKASADLTETPG